MRCFGSVLLVVLMTAGLAAPAAGVELPWLKSKTLFIESPAPGTIIWVNNFYADGGQKLMSVMYSQTSSDIYFDGKRRYSEDNGQNWSAWEAIDPPPAPPSPPYPPGGTRRQYLRAGWVDPVNGRMLMMANDGIFDDPSNPAEGYKRWQLRYRVSTDGGRTFAVDEQMIQQGGEYNALHPADGVYWDQNAIMVGAWPCVPIRTQQGKVLVPVQISRSSAGYLDTAVLIGTWGEGEDLSMQWDLSERVVTDGAHSTRGLFEPTLAEMPGDRILMVCRGSNNGNGSLPGYKWYSVSTDGGAHWSSPNPWTYNNGSNFFSPSSCSRLLKHSNGKYYWIGNICSSNPSGNSPRYPLVIGEVNSDTLLLEEDTVVIIDTLGAGDNGSLQLSNFLAYEDRLNGDIVLQMTRAFTSPSFSGDSYIYRIGVPVPEPTGMVLLISAAVGLLAYTWRRRRWIRI